VLFLRLLQADSPDGSTIHAGQRLKGLMQYFPQKKNNDFGLARSPFYSYLKVNDCSSDMRGGCAPLRLWNELSKELRQPGASEAIRERGVHGERGSASL